jgi:hypothetical protein
MSSVTTMGQYNGTAGGWSYMQRRGRVRKTWVTMPAACGWRGEHEAHMDTWDGSAHEETTAGDLTSRFKKNNTRPNVWVQTPM